MGIIERLHHDEAFTPAEQRVAAFMRDDAERLLGMTVRDVAAEVACSPSAVMRVLHKVYDGSFTDFKIAYALELQHAQTANVVPVRPIGRRETSNATKGIVSKIMRDTVGRTEASLDYRQLDRITRMLMAADWVGIYANGINARAALNFRYLMGRIGHSVHVVEGDTDEVSRVIGLKRQKRVALFMSHRSQNRRVLDKIELNRRNGTKIIYITGKLDSTVAHLCDEVVHIEAGNEFADLAPIVYGTSAEYVLNTLFACCFAFDYEGSMRAIGEFVTPPDNENA